MCVKIDYNIPIHLGKNFRKAQGGIFLTHTVDTVLMAINMKSNPDCR